MRRTYASWFAFAVGFALLGQACSAQDPQETESVGTTTEGATKCNGGTNGDFNYCDDPACPCDSGEGDCDADYQCTASPGLVCGTHIGLRWGQHWSNDVCWPATCQNGLLDPGEVTVDNGGPCGCELKDWYLDADLDGWGRNMTPVRYCSAPGFNWVQTTGDCHDTDPNIHPGATEICGDGIDNNCNGQVDDGCAAQTWCLDGDGDGYPRNTSCVVQVKQPAFNWLAVTGATQYDCNDANPAINPAATEVCNGVDDNCNGQIDEGTLKTWYVDGDGDSYPRSTGGVQRCTKPGPNWYDWGGPFDCNDANPAVNPGAAEICGDGIDNNCDGQIDNDCLPTHCYNSVQDGNETGLDCGGFCNVCSNGPAPSSCVGLAATCGASQAQNCCSATTVFGANYLRSYDATASYSDSSNPATVYSLRLDWYEVTVGRFRKFVQAYDAWRSASNPSAGAGSHPLIPGSGWDATWTLAADAATLTANVKCDASYQTWTDAAAGSENQPINCVNFYEAFAFCAWDGGRLPTEAEWNLAAAGGSQQRAYPWSSPPTNTAINSTNAAYGCILDGSASCAITDIARAGQLSAGLGRYLQAEMAGNVWEWNLDWYQAAYPNPCVNCSNLSPAVQQFRVIRGGSWQSGVSNLRTAARSIGAPGNRYVNVGLRCARGG